MSTRWQVYSVGELIFHASRTYDNGYLESDILVGFRSPSGRHITAYGFWDGEDRWCVRFAPDEPGEWHWYSMASAANHGGLHGRHGSFIAVDEHRTPTLRHGYLRIHVTARRFVYSDGTPFFWLGDTVWSAAAHAELSEWKRYLSHRSGQGFNVAQINSLPQWDASAGFCRTPFAPAGGQSGKATYDFDRPEPVYFQTLDRLVEDAAKAGIHCAMVVLWFNYVAGTNASWARELPRHRIRSDQALRYGRFLSARYSAYGTLWIVSGDTDAPVEGADEVYDSAARGVIEAAPNPVLLTAHLNGGIPTPESWNEKTWLDFHMFQSCHFRDSHERAVRYATVDRGYRPSRPVLNGEPIYDGIRFMDAANSEGERCGRDYLRRVAWTSVLSGACAGLTYGAHGLWAWHRDGQRYEEMHYGLPPSWHEALELPSGGDVATMKRILESFSWGDLVPDPPDRYCVRSDEALPAGTVGAHTPEGAALIFLPEKPEGNLEIDTAGASVRWVSPTTGQVHSVALEARTGRQRLPLYPWEGDALLMVDPGSGEAERR